MKTTAWTRMNLATRQADGTLKNDFRDVLFQVEIDVDRLVDDMKRRAYYSPRKKTSKASGAITVSLLQVEN